MYFYLNQYILLVSLYYFSYVHSYQWNNYPFNPIGGIEQRIVSGMWRKNVEIDNNHSLKDNIQNAAQKEGIYVTNNDTRMHIFSHTEAIQCLSKRNIAIAGDSYMVQLMIGLVDILLNDPSNKEITSGQMRTEVLQQRDSELLSKNFDFRLKYTPEKCRHGGIECLIDYFKNLHASNSTKNKYADVYIVNILVHHIMSLPKADHLSFKKHSLEEFRKSKYSVALESLFMYVIRHDIPMLWLTGPGHILYDHPHEHRHKVRMHVFNDTMELYNEISLELALKYKIPSINIQPMTSLCVWKNCISDGSHRARFVNRMKAQLVLNTLCN